MSGQNRVREALAHYMPHDFANDACVSPNALEAGASLKTKNNFKALYFVLGWDGGKSFSTYEIENKERFCRNSKSNSEFPAVIISSRKLDSL